MNKHAVGWASEAPTPAQLKELFAQIESGKITKNKLQSLLRGKEKQLESGFPTKVNYDLLVESLVAQGKYDWKNSDINSKNFQTTRKGEATFNLDPVHFNEVLTSEEVCKKLDERGLRPAELHELLSFGAQYPEEQRKYPIAALASVWQGGDRSVPCLWGVSGRRGLGLYWFGHRWLELYRFLAVSK